MNALFIGPSLSTGIGQVTLTLSAIVDAEYVVHAEKPNQEIYDVGFYFIIPLDSTIELAKRYSSICRKMVYMTVCETESVHKIYERLFELSQTFLVPSEFAAKVLKRQFPRGDF